MQRNPGFSNWLKESPCLSVGARAFLMQRFGIVPRPRTPFVPVTLFGCARRKRRLKRMAPGSGGARG